MKAKKSFLLVFLLLLGVISCGKKGALENPPNYARPSFSGVVEEE